MPPNDDITENYSDSGWTPLGAFLLMVLLVILAALLVFVVIPQIDQWLNPSQNIPLQPPVNVFFSVGRVG